MPFAFEMRRASWIAKESAKNQQESVSSDPGTSRPPRSTCPDCPLISIARPKRPEALRVAGETSVPWRPFPEESLIAVPLVSSNAQPANRTGSPPELCGVVALAGDERGDSFPDGSRAETR